jgi:hypothetical protein
MTPLERCLQTLRVVIGIGDPHAIDLAETAIDQYISTHDDTDHKIAALNVLDRELLLISQNVSDGSSEFVTSMFGYIDSRIRALRDL